MAKLMVYFEAAPDADLQQAATAVQEKAVTLPGVTSASAQPMVTHGFGPHEIMMGIQMASGVMASATGAVLAVTELLKALNKLADEAPALSRALVQVGLKKVPVAEVTPQDVQKLAGKS